MLRRLDVLLERVEARVVDQLQPALRLVVRPFEELAVLVERDRHLRHQQRAGEAVLDLQADVVADARLVQRLEIGGVGRDHHIGDAAQMLARPFARLVLPVAGQAILLGGIGSGLTMARRASVLYQRR